MMLHTKCQGSWPNGFRREGFYHVFPTILCKTCEHRGGAIFSPRGRHNMNKPGRHTKYQGSRLAEIGRILEGPGT